MLPKATQLTGQGTHDCKQTTLLRPTPCPLEMAGALIAKDVGIKARETRFTRSGGADTSAGVPDDQEGEA